MMLVIEKYWPFIVTAIVVLVWFFGLGQPFPNQSDSLLAASGTVSAVLFGFLGTSKAIMLGLAGRRIAQQLKTAGYDKVLFKYLREATYCSVLLLIISITGFFVPLNSGNVPIGLFAEYFPVVWMTVAVCSIALYVRIIHIFFKLLEANFSS